jgi:hypothetical protein
VRIDAIVEEKVPGLELRSGAAEAGRMWLTPIASKIIGGACVVALSFWITLKLLDYRESATATSIDSTVTENDASRGSASARRTMRLFDERSSRVDNLAVAWNAAEGPDGSRTAIFLDDRSKIYGSIAQEVPIANDDKTHTVSIDFKADTSPIAEIVMIYQGGGQQKPYYVFVHLNNPFEDMLPTGEGQISSKFLGNNWFRVTLSGANNASGNTKLLVQFYPRHGAPQDTGSAYIANPILDP